MNPSSFVHTGVAVADLEVAMDVVGKQLRVTWATPQRRHVDAIWGDGALVANVTVTWSIEGPPHVELVAGGPGTPWETALVSELHHLAYWSDDLIADVGLMVQAGSALELTGASLGGTPASFAYVKAKDGLRIELMDRAVMKPAFDAWLAGGSLPATVS